MANYMHRVDPNAGEVAGRSALPRAEGRSHELGHTMPRTHTDTPHSGMRRNGVRRDGVAGGVAAGALADRGVRAWNGSAMGLPAGGAGSILQAKLQVNRPGDRYEQEADRVADAVVGGGAAAVAGISALDGGTTQRKCAECEQEEEQRAQRKETSGGAGVNAAAAVEHGTSGGGEAIPAGERDVMESRIGADFGAVRIHRDGSAASAARALNARAFTVGRDVVFGAGEYQPGTHAGRHLLAHELTHVVQQHGGNTRVQRAPDDKPPAADPAPKPSRVAGDTKAKKKMYIAWTVDDGPQKQTDKMMETGLAEIKGTWYIQQNKLTSEESWKKLRAMQDAGYEIAIHSFHPTQDHSVWFPIPEHKSGAYSIPYDGKAEIEIMKDLRDFKKRLEKYGVNVRFVRLPGGLWSELRLYAQKLDLEEPGKVATAIIAAKDAAGYAAVKEKYGESGIRILEDFNVLRETLSELDLLEWGGSSDPKEIKSVSWEAESSGVTAREDTVSGHVSQLEKRTAKDKKYVTNTASKFEHLLAKVTEEIPRSMVVLSHDTTAEDVAEVRADIVQMENAALENKVRLEYYTMSQIFELVTKQKAKGYDVIYPTARAK